MISHNQSGKSLNSDLLMVSISKFYTSKNYIQRILPIVNGTSRISLRLVDWFVTNYAKRHTVGYVLGGQEFMVYMSYKSQLKAYSKKLFDPFCRRERIMFSLPGVDAFVTTVGKLNFFRWAIEKNIIEYLKVNRETVETEMNSHMKQLSRSRSTRNTTTSSDGSATEPVTTTTTAANVVTQKRVRTAFQTSPPQTLCRRDVEIKVGFD